MPPATLRGGAKRVVQSEYIRTGSRRGDTVLVLSIQYIPVYNAIAVLVPMCADANAAADLLVAIGRPLQYCTSLMMCVGGHPIHNCTPSLHAVVLAVRPAAY